MLTIISEELPVAWVIVTLDGVEVLLRRPSLDARDAAELEARLGRAAA